MSLVLTLLTPTTSSFFFFNDTATTEIYTLSLHDALPLAPYGCAGERSAPGVVVNDIHSQLNATRVHRVVKPPSVDAVVQLVQSARQEGRPLSIAGGRHAMGGQQFGSETTLVDMGSMNRVLGFDAARGLIDVEAGIQWPELMGPLGGAEQGGGPPGGIPQKEDGRSGGGRGGEEGGTRGGAV